MTIDEMRTRLRIELRELERMEEMARSVTGLDSIDQGDLLRQMRAAQDCIATAEAWLADVVAAKGGVL